MWSDRRCQASSIWLEHQFGALVCGSVQQASRIRLSRANVRIGVESGRESNYAAIDSEPKSMRATTRVRRRVAALD